MDRIQEKDWGKLRSMGKNLLDKAVGNSLSKIRLLIDERQGGNHKAYSALWDLIRDEDKKIRNMFDDMKRSEAIQKIAFMCKYKIIDEDILREFSKETQERVNTLIQII